MTALPRIRQVLEPAACCLRRKSPGSKGSQWEVACAGAVCRASLMNLQLDHACKEHRSLPWPHNSVLVPVAGRHGCQGYLLPRSEQQQLQLPQYSKLSLPSFLLPSTLNHSSHNLSVLRTGELPGQLVYALGLPKIEADCKRSALRMSASAWGTGRSC